MDFQTIKEAIETETKRFYTLKTKAARCRSNAKLRALRVQAADILDKAVLDMVGRELTGTVRLVDDRDGDLWIDTVEYGRVYGNITSAVESKSWYPTTCCVDFIVGSEVSFTLTAEVDFERSAIRLGAKAGIE
jgi:hypothetical protein